MLWRQNVTDCDAECWVLTSYGLCLRIFNTFLA